MTSESHNNIYTSTSIDIKINGYAYDIDIPLYEKQPKEKCMYTTSIVWLVVNLLNSVDIDNQNLNVVGGKKKSDCSQFH